MFELPMGLFDIFKTAAKPYKNPAINLIYELLFCDDIELYEKNNTQADSYPWDILFSNRCAFEDLEHILSDHSIDSRVKILMYNKLLGQGHLVDKKELLGVIIEVGLDNGLDVLASYKDGTARYINQSGKVIIWETVDESSKALTDHLFDDACQIIQKIGPWDKPRRPSPEKGMVRLTFLVSDGLYFGEGPVDKFFIDELAGPPLSTATKLMQYLTDKAQQ